jgi:hypothetical protein
MIFFQFSAFRLFKKKMIFNSIKLKTKWEYDGFGHSAGTDNDDNILLSWGVLEENGEPFLKGNNTLSTTLDVAINGRQGSINYPIRGYNTSINVNNLRLDKYTNYANSLVEKKVHYTIHSMHCAVAQSKALLHAGVFNIPILRFPYFLDFQMRIRNISHLNFLLHSNF